MAKQTANHACHYTSLENAIAIINGMTVPNKDCAKPFERGGTITLHASRYSSMNDPNEYEFARKKTQKFFPPKEKSEDNTQTPSFIPYVLSFCMDIDNPIMWRLYNAKIGFIFDKSRLWCSADDDFHFEWLGHSVDYLGEEEGIEENKGLYQLAQRLKTSAEKFAGNTPVDEYNELLLQYAIYPFVKHKDFQIEKEWRIVYPNVLPMETSPQNIDNEIRHELRIGTKCKGIRRGHWFLYREVRLPFDALKHIIINEHSLESYSKVKELLTILLENKKFNLSTDFFCQTKTAEVI